VITARATSDERRATSDEYEYGHEHGNDYGNDHDYESESESESESECEYEYEYEYGQGPVGGSGGWHVGRGAGEVRDWSTG
jgi:hypothetical protein